MFYEDDEELFDEIMNPIYNAQKKYGIVSSYEEYMEKKNIFLQKAKDPSPIEYRESPKK